MLTLIASDPTDYLGSDAVVESEDREVVRLSRTLRDEFPSDLEFASAAFEWVRDEIAHSVDAQDPRVTLTASEVLRERVGFCYAKSHLLTAVLRAEGIPAGLCYQRLRDGTGFSLHGLVAVHLKGGWHRLDPRGNKPGIDARFSLNGEQLAFTINEDAGEVDYPIIHVSPSPNVVHALSRAANALKLADGGLPTYP